MKNKVIYFLIVNLFFLLLTSCWDNVEIDKRAFIYLMGVDINNKYNENDSDKHEKSFDESANSKLKVLFFNPIPANLLPGAEVKAFKSETEFGANISDAIRNLAGDFERQPFYGQLKVLVLGEKLLADRKCFKETMDFMERQHEINIDIKTIILKGQIDDLKKIKPSFEKILAMYTMGILKNIERRTPKITPEIHEVFSSLRAEKKGNAVIPCFEVKKDKLEISGLALIKDYKLLEIVDKKYIKGYSLILGDLKVGKRISEFKNHTSVCDISSVDRKIRLISDKEPLHYKIKYSIEADLEENYFAEYIFDKKVIRELEKNFSRDIEKELEEVTKKFQKDIGVDYLKINDYTHKYHNSIYKKYKSNWDNTFKNAVIDYEVDLVLRRVGSTKE